MPQNILVTGADLAPEAVQLLQDYNLIYAGKTPDEAALINLCAIHNPIAIIVRYGKITENVLKAAPKLKVVSKHGSGIDTIDVETATKLNIAVKAASGANAAAVAEHTIALMLALAKGIVPLDKRMREGFWDKATHKSFELKGKTLGLVGYGAIGQRVGEIAKAMGMVLAIHDPYHNTSLSLSEVLETSDMLSLHCPLTKDNHHLINRETIKQMKNGAYLINTARGGLIDEDALIEACLTQKITAAALDSFQIEPLKGEHRFTKISNILLSPHIGGVTKDAYIAMGVGAAQNILNALNNGGNHA